MASRCFETGSPGGSGLFPLMMLTSSGFTVTKAALLAPFGWFMHTTDSAKADTT
jgi:hypothetical protein